MDVISINWEQGILECLWGGQRWISLIEHGDLLQSTGRKDRYKKEIYEGHIIIPYDHIGATLPMEVYWDESVSGFRCRRETFTEPLPASKNVEVIGTMSENPELLLITSL
jgi:YopX protein